MEVVTNEQTFFVAAIVAIIVAFLIQSTVSLKTFKKWQKPIRNDVKSTRDSMVQLFTEPAFDKNKPHAVLVGVGPVDTSLLTIAALKVLSEAQLLLCDRLVSHEILDLLQEINPTCEIRMSSKCKKRSNSTKVQNQLNNWLVEGMDKGLNVCRLKGGDPFLFGRGMEEVEAVLRRGYRIKVIPGISSGFSAPLSAGISVTKRNAANKVMIATAHGQFDTYPDMPNFRKDCTLVFLMGVSRLESLMNELMSKGFLPDTQVCIIERATTTNQRQVSGSISTISSIAKTQNVQAPATIVVGNVCANDELISGYHSVYKTGGVIFIPPLSS